MTIQWSTSGIQNVPARGVPRPVPVAKVVFDMTGSTAAAEALAAHVVDETPHPVYDNSSEPDPVVVFENGLI